MSFELDANGGCLVEGSPSLLHEAMDHVRNTWSKVLSGKGSTQDYAEAAIEATAVVAASAFAFKGGMKLLSAESRVGARVADPELLAAIRNAAKGDSGGLGRKVALGPNGLPYVAAELRLGTRVADPEMFTGIREAAKGDLASAYKNGANPSAYPLAARDLKSASVSSEFGHDANAFRLPAVGMKSVTPPLTPDGFYRSVGPRIDAPGAKLLQPGKSAAKVAMSDRGTLVVQVHLPGSS